MNRRPIDSPSAARTPSGHLRRAGRFRLDRPAAHDQAQQAPGRSGENGEFVGVLEDIDLLSFLAGNAQLVAAQIDRASTVADLAAAAQKIEPQIRTLRRQGVKIEVVAEIVSDLNRRLHAKLFSLIAPPSIRERGCLIVMGSEGRGEQTFRTDQDNGLILSEPVAGEGPRSIPRRVFDALETFGFPPCPGKVMVRNPQWSKTAAEFRDDFRRWLALSDETGV